MWYITPVGNSCTDEERQLFSEFDAMYGFRSKVIKELSLLLRGHNLDLKLGGQIGIGCHPIGWDKSYVYQFLEKETYTV